MPSLAAIREQRRSERLVALREGAAVLVASHPGSEVWLFGSLARGDWDGFSDVDLLAVAPTAAAADALADSLLDRRLGDDVLVLTRDRWDRLRRGDDPYWQAIGRDALCLAP